MEETTDTHSRQSYYPPTKHMAADNSDGGNSNKLPIMHNKPTMELTLLHDQWKETPVVGTTTSDQQQKHLPSVRCTLCQDEDNNVLFYRPSMTLHTLFQVPDEPTAARYTKKRHTLELEDDGHLSTNSPAEARHQSTDHAGGDDETHHRLVIPKPRQCYATLYASTDDQPLWTFVEQDWHSMTLLSRQPPHHAISMTTSTFSFVWGNNNDGGLYQWRMQLGDDPTMMDLLCEQWQADQTKRPVAWLKNGATRLALFTGNEASNNNPFRTAQSPLETFLVLSGLLLYELICSQVRTLGGGVEAMTMMIDRQQHALAEETRRFYTDKQRGLYEDDMDDRSRWSSTGSLKSLELDQGWWRCWRVPWCVPGSWCDRAWIKTRGGYHHRSRVTRRMQVSISLFSFSFLKHTYTFFFLDRVGNNRHR